MEENNQITGGEPTSQVEALSKSEAMVGVITSPSDTFETIAHSPKMNYWILPIIFFVIANLIGSFIVQNDTELINKIMDKQRAKVQQDFDEKVKSGAMTQEQADESMKMAEKFMDPTNLFFKIIGYGAGIITPFLYLFVGSLIALIIMKVMRSAITFGDILNIVGLASIISAISAILTTIISVLMGDLQTISLGLVLNESMIGEKGFALVSRLDLFSLWYLAVVSIGLSKIGRVSFAPVAGILYGLWIVYAVFMSLVF